MRRGMEKNDRCFNGRILAKTFTRASCVTCLFLLGASNAQAAVVMVSPTAGIPGSTFYVSGTGYTPGEQLSIWWDFPLVRLGATNADDSGAFANVPFTVPKDPQTSPPG